MAIEIEKKYRLTEAQYQEMETALEEEQAEFTGEDFEENTIYTNWKMKRDKCVIRIRKTDGKTLLTLKKKIQNHLAFKRQIEHETLVADAEALENIVAHLDMRAAIIYEKRRKKWKFKNTEVVLDELPFGLYMEIEGKLMDIAMVEMILGAEEFTDEPKTYLHLTKKFGEKSENERKEKVFAARFPKKS
jgi:adenylate cyclase class 2